jgi:hypothetical protein
VIESHQEGSLFPVVVVAVGFIVAKILAMVGIANDKNCNAIATFLSVVAGAGYAFIFPMAKSFGPIGDIMLRILFGAMVGGVLWIFILIGVGAALSKEKK